MLPDRYYVEVWYGGLFQRVVEFASQHDAQRYADAVRSFDRTINTLQYNTATKDKP